MGVFDISSDDSAAIDEQANNNIAAQNDPEHGIAYKTTVGAAKNYFKGTSGFLANQLDLAGGGALITGLSAIKKPSEYQYSEDQPSANEFLNTEQQEHDIDKTKDQAVSSYFNAADPMAKQVNSFWTPGANETNMAGRIIGGLGSFVARAGMSGFNPLVMGAGSFSDKAKESIDQGTDLQTAEKRGAVEGVTNATFLATGGVVGKTLLQKMLSSAAFNTGTGIASEQANKSILERDGYNDLADQIKPLDKENMEIAFGSGLVFGGLHYHGEGKQLAHDLENLSPSDKAIITDAFLTQSNAEHYVNETAPGEPATPKDIALHTKAMDTAINQLSHPDGTVNIPADILDAKFVPRDNSDRNSVIHEGIKQELEAMHGTDQPLDNTGDFNYTEPVNKGDENASESGTKNQKYTSDDLNFLVESGSMTQAEADRLRSAPQNEDINNAQQSNTPEPVTGYDSAERDLLARIVRTNSALKTDIGGAKGFVPQEWVKPSKYTDLSLREGSFTRDERSQEVIKQESDRLISSAKKNGFFVDDAAASDLFKKIGSNKAEGGREHDVFLLNHDAKNGLVIKSTADGRYGPDKTKSPAQYLKRIEDYNKTFPELQMRVFGVGHDDNGMAVIHTAQKFIDGSEFKSMDDLQKALEDKGWEALDRDHDGKATAHRFRNTKTGAIINDVHQGNVLHDEHGNLHPIDVHIEKLPNVDKKSSEPSKAETPIAGESKPSLISRATTAIKRMTDKMPSSMEGVPELKMASDIAKQNPDMKITLDDGSEVSAHDALANLQKQIDQVKNDEPAYEAAVNCYRQNI